MCFEPSSDYDTKHTIHKSHFVCVCLTLDTARGGIVVVVVFLYSFLFASSLLFRRVPFLSLSFFYMKISLCVAVLHVIRSQQYGNECVSMKIIKIINVLRSRVKGDESFTASHLSAAAVVVTASAAAFAAVRPRWPDH